MTETINSPEALKTDLDSMAFYVLRDEQLVICKDHKEVAYWQNRSTYLSMGRFSPKFKTVIFWPDPVNPTRAMHLLKEHKHIGEDFNYTVAGLSTTTPKSKLKKDPTDRLDGVRKREVEILLDRGMVRQQNENNSEENSA